MTITRNYPGIDGNWVYFEDGDKQIDVYISNFFWRQAVYVDGEKISQRYKFVNHPFWHKDNGYKLKFSYINFREGVCELYKNGEMIAAKHFSLYDEKSAKDFAGLVILHMVFAVGLGVVTIAIWRLIKNLI